MVRPGTSVRLLCVCLALGLWAPTRTANAAPQQAAPVEEVAPITAPAPAEAAEPQQPPAAPPEATLEEPLVQQPVVYKLVEPRLIASELQNAQVIGTIVLPPRPDRSIELAVYAGVHAWPLDEVNRELGERGYSQVSSATPVFGLWIGAGWERWRMAALFGGAGENFRHLREEIDARLYYLMVELQAGYNVYRDHGLSVYPLVGLVGGATTVWAKTSNAQRVPLFGERIGNVDDGFQASTPIFLLDLGIGIQSVLGLDASGESGIGLGLQLGYLIQWLDVDWSNDHDDGPGLTGPKADVGGAYVRLSIGWGLDTRRIEHVRGPVEECEGPACELVCDRGFADCDGDPRNGCEAQLPAAGSPAAARCIGYRKPPLILELH